MSSSSSSLSNKSSKRLSVLADVASRRRQRSEGEPHYVVLTFLMPDDDRVIPVVVRAGRGGRFSGADVYSAAVDASPYEFPRNIFSDSLRVYQDNALVLPFQIFRTDRDREFFVSPSMGLRPHWHVRRGWVFA
jgi:hypothetical protein